LLIIDRFFQYDYNSHIKQYEAKMKTAPVSDLKAHLSEYLDRVKAGAEVLVTDRGKAVARLTPVSRGEATNPSLVKMEREGLIRVGSGLLPPDFWDMQRPEDPDGLVRQVLIEERGAGR
jgi:prevent-host-death family protein